MTCPCSSRSLAVLVAALLVCAAAAQAFDEDMPPVRRRDLSQTISSRPLLETGMQSTRGRLKLGNSRSNVRPVKGGRVENAKNELCYGICTTCVCDVGEQLNCCVREGKDRFDGCVTGNALSLCATSRPVNSCCR